MGGQVRGVKAHVEFTQVKRKGYGCRKNIVVLKLVCADGQLGRQLPTPWRHCFTYTYRTTQSLRTFAIKRILEAPYVDFGIIKDPCQLRVCLAPRG